jgi:zinc protease
MRNGVLLVLLLITGCFSQARTSVYANWVGTRVRLDTPYTKVTLSNGLEVILNEDHRLPVVAVRLVYLVGTKDDPPGRGELAHLSEHLMFQGSRHVGEDMLFKYLEQAGASSIDGRTSPEITSYSETVPSSQLDLALWLESDRMAFMLDHVNEQTLEIQRAVVQNELRQRFENAPYGRVEQLIRARLYPPGHPYHGSADREGGLGRATLGDIRAFLETYYRPNNACLYLSGDFLSRDAEQKVRAYFGPIVPGPPPGPSPVVAVAPLSPGARLDIEAEVPLARITLSWLTPAFGEAGDAELDVIARMLASARLRWRLVRELQIATDVTSRQRSMKLGSIFDIGVGVRAGVAIEVVVNAIDEVLASFRNRPQSAVFIRSMTFPLLLDLLSLNEHPTGRGSQMATSAFLTGDPAFVQNNIARYENVTPDAIQSAVAGFLAPDRRLLTVVTPRRGAPAAGHVVGAR